MTLRKTFTASVGVCLIFNTYFFILVTDGHEFHFVLHLFILSSNNNISFVVDTVFVSRTYIKVPEKLNRHFCFENVTTLNSTPQTGPSFI